MKRLLIVIFACSAMLSATAQHYLGADIAGCFAWQHDRLDFTKPNLAGGGSAGALYEYQVRHLLIQTGVGAALTWTSMSVTESPLEYRMIDSEGIAFVYRGIIQNRNDRARMFELQVPLRLGVEYSYFYALAGARFALNLSTAARSTAMLKTTGDYGDRYYEQLEDMPNHGFHDFEAVGSTSRLRFRPDLRVEAELGGNIPISARNTIAPKLRLGVFFSYGVLNVLNASGDTSMSEADLSNHLQLTLNHVYASRESLSTPVNNLQTGIRLTFLFPVGDTKDNKKAYLKILYPCRCEKLQ